MNFSLFCFIQCVVWFPSGLQQHQPSKSYMPVRKANQKPPAQFPSHLTGQDSTIFPYLPQSLVRGTGPPWLAWVTYTPDSFSKTGKVVPWRKWVTLLWYYGWENKTMILIVGLLVAPQQQSTPSSLPTEPLFLCRTVKCSASIVWIMISEAIPRNLIHFCQILAFPDSCIMGAIGHGSGQWDMSKCLMQSLTYLHIYIYLWILSV